jgi:hypothetical protein
MKISKDDAVKMDRVLSYLISDNKARVKSKQIQNLLGIELDEAKNIYHSILNYNKEIEPVVSFLFASNISARPIITEEFLKRGGFSAISNAQIISENQEPFDLMKCTKKSFMKEYHYKIVWVAIFTSILAFIMALVSLLFSMGFLI